MQIGRPVFELPRGKNHNATRLTGLVKSWIWTIVFTAFRQVSWEGKKPPGSIIAISTSHRSPERELPLYVPEGGLCVLLYRREA